MYADRSQIDGNMGWGATAYDRAKALTRHGRLSNAEVCDAGARGVLGAMAMIVRAQKNTAPSKTRSPIYTCVNDQSLWTNRCGPIAVANEHAEAFSAPSGGYKTVSQLLLVAIIVTVRRRKPGKKGDAYKMGEGIIFNRLR